jgi:hypothetical protein
LVVPALPAAFGSDHDERFARSLGGPTADGESRIPEGSIAHSVVVVFDVDDVLVQFAPFITAPAIAQGFDEGIDLADGLVVLVERLLPTRQGLLAPRGQLAPEPKSIGETFE